MISYVIKGFWSRVEIKKGWLGNWLKAGFETAGIWTRFQTLEIKKESNSKIEFSRVRITFLFILCNYLARKLPPPATKSRSTNTTFQVL